jgi:hypothetical protein
MQPSLRNAEKWALVGTVIGALLVVGAAAGSYLESSFRYYYWSLPSRPEMILIGICGGQMSLIAAWSVLARWHIFLRLVGAILLTGFLWLSLMAGVLVGFQSDLRYYFDYYVAEDVALGVVLVAGVALSQIPFWIARCALGWRLVGWGGELIQAGRPRLQFHLWHLVLVMVSLSVAFAFARLMLTTMDMGSFEQLIFAVWGELDWKVLGRPPLLIFGSLLVTLPGVWSAFQGAKMIIPLLLGWLLYCALVGELQFLLFVLLPYAPIEEVDFVGGYLLNVAHAATVIGVLLLLRALGCRLLREPKRRERCDAPEDGEGGEAGAVDDAG